ncbi:hypothetical protein ONZ45_g14529 [Pleurotus djamor]|nr:hypothetical protein ONZ45_g14529 [Pleurotus djamor]
MGFRRISSDLKECALTLRQRDWEIADISDVLGVSPASIYRWLQNMQEFGNVNRPAGSRGPSRRLTSAVVETITELLSTEPDLYLDELVVWLAINHDIAVSRPTVHQTLLDAGITRKLLSKSALERDFELRTEWMQTIQGGDFEADGSQFIFVDETSKDEHIWARSHGRSHAGERAALSDVFVQGDRYSLVAVLGIDGYVAAEVIPGSYDGLSFYEFIQEQVLIHMNPFPGARSVLVMDNCRIHHNPALVNLVRAAVCLLLYLPPYSPDYNPIEESFSLLKAYLRRHAHTLRHSDDPVQVLLEACGCITAAASREWFKHAGYVF